MSVRVCTLTRRISEHFTHARASAAVHNRARLTRRCAPGCAAAPRCLQYEVVDGNGDLRRLDFAWPRYRVAVEYDGLDWHSDPDAMRNDRKHQAALADLGLVVISVVFEDVRYRAWDFVARVNQHFGRTHAA